MPEKFAAMSKMIRFIIAGFIFLSTASAQTYRVQWGEEMKIKKGSVDTDIIHADKTGVYMVEGKVK